MKILTAVLICLSLALFAQRAEPILFTEKVHDFGEIQENGGKVEFEFTFTNNTARAIKIVTVDASCGCTTTGYTQEAIAQGNKGLIKASFDPKGRQGYFNKSITVATDYEATPLVLQIKGQVITVGEKDPMVELPAKNGSLRLRLNNFNVGKTFINKDAIVKDFAVYNSSDKPIHLIKKTIKASYIDIIFPTVLNPNQKAYIKIKFDAKLRNQYGFVTDAIEIETDDVLQPIKSFAVYATVEEFFPSQSEAELAKAPILQLSSSTAELGRMVQSNEVSREVIFLNGGKKELTIRAIQPNCTCLSTSLEKFSLKPGESTLLKLSFNPTGRNGGQNKSITIYSNDPQNPVQRINVNGYIPTQN